MFNQYSKHDFKELNLKLKKSINYNLNLFAEKSNTKKYFYKIQCKKDEFLIKQGEKIPGIYIISKGKVKVFNIENDKYTILKLATKGDLVGLSSLNFQNALSSIAAYSNVEAYFISLKHLKTILKNNPKLSFLLINYLSLDVQFLGLRQKHNALFSVNGRVAEALLIIANAFGKKSEKGIVIKDCIQRKEIAAVANTTYETVIRELKKLKLAGVIEAESKQIIIKDKSYLLNSLKKHCRSTKKNEDNASCTYLDLIY